MAARAPPGPHDPGRATADATIAAGRPSGAADAGDPDAAGVTVIGGSDPGQMTVARALLTDMYTARGRTADERGDPAQALHWFANAARVAGNDPGCEGTRRVTVPTGPSRREILHPEP